MKNLDLIQISQIVLYVLLWLNLFAFISEKSNLIKISFILLATSFVLVFNFLFKIDNKYTHEYVPVFFYLVYIISFLEFIFIARKDINDWELTKVNFFFILSIALAEVFVWKLEYSSWWGLLFIFIPIICFIVIIAMIVYWSPSPEELNNHSKE